MLPRPDMSGIPRRVKILPGLVREHVRESARLLMKFDTRNRKLGNSFPEAAANIEDALWRVAHKRIDVEVPWVSESIYFNTEYYPPALMFQAELRHYFIFPLSFLDRLRGKRPGVYRLVRDLIHYLLSWGLITSTAQWVDFYGYDIGSDIESMEDERDRDAATHSVEGELRSFAEHFGGKPPQDLLNVRRRMAALRLRRRERKWIDILLSALGARPRVLRYFVPEDNPDDYDCCDRYPLHDFFIATWEKGGFLVNQMEFFLQNPGDIMGPVATVHIEGPEHIEAARDCMGFLRHMGEIMMQGEEVWKT